jgi:hypothetical protein
MKSKSLFTQYMEEFSASSQEYCCYCCEPRSGNSCCQENHFVEFKDLYEEDQIAIIEHELQMAFELENKQ